MCNIINKCNVQCIFQLFQGVHFFFLGLILFMFEYQLKTDFPDISILLFFLVDANISFFGNHLVHSAARFFIKNILSNKSGQKLFNLIRFLDFWLTLKEVVVKQKYDTWKEN